MIQRLLEQTTVEGAIETILDDVIAMHGAEYGNVQILIGNGLPSWPSAVFQRNF